MPPETARAEAARGVWPAIAAGDVTVQIGGISTSLRTRDPDFQRLLEERYSGFVNPAASPHYVFDVEIASPTSTAADDDVRVWKKDGVWHVTRGDFRAGWNAGTRRGLIRQSANPFSADTLLRVVHSIALAGEGGFLLHAASAVRGGRAFLFAGGSGGGKTTMARLAPCGVRLLTDEISYVRREGAVYRAYGTPFAGELARLGENTSAPVAGVFFLAKGRENGLEPLDAAEAARALLRNILFLTEDGELVQRVFHSALEFVSAVASRRLVFTPDARAWELIR